MPSTPNGNDPDPILKGRAVVTPELGAYWQHRRDVAGPSIVAAYEQAAEVLPRATPLQAAANGHLAVLSQRGTGIDEGAQTPEVARQRLGAARGQLAAGIAEGQAVSTEAEQRLQALQGEAAASRLEGHAGVDHLTPWIAGRVVAALGLDGPVDLEAFTPSKQ